MKNTRHQSQSGELLPKEHKETKMKNLQVSNLRYCDDNNPEELERSNNALASYAKKHKMGY